MFMSLQKIRQLSMLRNGLRQQLASFAFLQIPAEEEIWKILQMTKAMFSNTIQ